MLQQTQVERVVPKYGAFLKKFPTVHALAKAPLSAVLREWQGLGYNRRAKLLHNAAQDVALLHKGTFPRERADLEALSGIGPYTASAVRVFAYNQPDILIETNVRAVYLHHFFPKRKNVPDTALHPYMDAALDRKNPREWYSALMDYGSYLKKTVPNPSRRSAHHARQKPFKGSDREIRGAILKALAKEPKTVRAFSSLPFERERLSRQLSVLVQEGLVKKKGLFFALGE